MAEFLKFTKFSNFGISKYRHLESSNLWIIGHHRTLSDFIGLSDFENAKNLKMFYLIRIREFFRETAHEFKRQKFVAAAVLIAVASLCLMAVSVFYLTPTIISSGPFVICAATLNDELREQILCFLVVDVFVSLYLTWLFVIKSRALLALENANKNAMEQTEDSEEQKDETDEDMPLNGMMNGNTQMHDVPTTYFIDAKDGGLRATVKFLKCLLVENGKCRMLSILVDF